MTGPDITAVCSMSPLGPGLCVVGLQRPDSAVHPLLGTEQMLGTRAAVMQTIQTALPNMVAFLASYGVNLITFFCLSLVDEPKLLGAAGLGSLVGNIFGFSIGVGLTSVLDTLVSQSVGARNHYLSVIHLSRARLLSVLVTIPCFFLLWHLSSCLVYLGQDPEVSKLAAEFVHGTCWGLLPYFLSNALCSYMRCYNYTGSPVIVNLISCGFHFMISTLVIQHLGLRAFGAGICISATYFLRWILSETAMLCNEDTRYALQWVPLSLVLKGIKEYMALAISNSALLIIEWSSYELQALIAGWVGIEALAAHVAGANVVTCIFMGAIGISQAAAVLVGVALGESKPKSAKLFAISALGFTLVLYSLIAFLVIVFRRNITSVISSDPDVEHTLHGLLIVVGFFSLIDSLNGVSEGVLRGMGLQQKAVTYKLIAMFGVRLPVGYLLSLVWGVSGIWIGACAGMLTSCSAFWYIISQADFKKCSLRAVAAQRDGKLTDNTFIIDM